jgi:hypothetical protein
MATTAKTFTIDDEDLMSADEQTKMFDEIIHQSVENSNLNCNKYSNLVDTVAKKIVIRLNEETRNKNGIYYTCCFNNGIKTIKRNVPDKLGISGCKSREIFTIAKHGYCSKAFLHLNNKLTLDNYTKINKFIDYEVKFNQSLAVITINDLIKSLNRRGYSIESINYSCSGSRYMWLSNCSNDLELGVRISDHSLNNNNYLGAGVANLYTIFPGNDLIESVLSLIDEYEILKSEYGNRYTEWLWSQRLIEDINSMSVDELEFVFKI